MLFLFSIFILYIHFAYFEKFSRLSLLFIAGYIVRLRSLKNIIDFQLISIDYSIFIGLPSLRCLFLCTKCQHQYTILVNNSKKSNTLNCSAGYSRIPHILYLLVHHESCSLFDLLHSRSVFYSLHFSILIYVQYLI